MKTKLILLTIILIQTVTGYGQNYADLTGQWKGILNAQGTQLRAVFNLTKTDNGYSSTMDSPDQGVKGVPCNSVTVKGDSVIIQVMAGAILKGYVANDSTINGTWQQAGMGIPLVLKKAKARKDEKVEVAKTDDNFIETDITLETKTGQIFGTLCTPKKFTKIPVALIIAGSGPTDRDCNSPMSLHSDAYKLLAHKLCDYGIATVRYDKRGIGQSKDALKSETDIRFDDYISDASDWLKLLKADPRFSKVIIIGHSEGSLIGMIAGQKNADEFISIAGVGQTADKTIREQLKSQPQSLQDTAGFIIDSLAQGKTVKHVPSYMYMMFRPSVQPYMISWFKYDPQIEIKKLTIPVLIIQGKNDIQVSVDDAKRLAAAKPDAKLVLIDKMNHVFKDVEGDKREDNMRAYTDPTLPVDEKLVTTIETFINKK